MARTTTARTARNATPVATVGGRLSPHTSGAAVPSKAAPKLATYSAQGYYPHPKVLAAYKAATAKGLRGAALALACARATNPKAAKPMGNTQVAMYAFWATVPVHPQAKALLAQAQAGKQAPLASTLAALRRAGRSWGWCMAHLLVTQGTARAAVAAYMALPGGAAATVQPRTPNVPAPAPKAPRKRTARKVANPVTTTTVAPTAPAGPVPTTAS